VPSIATSLARRELLVEDEIPVVEGVVDSARILSFYRRRGFVHRVAGMVDEGSPLHLGRCGWNSSGNAQRVYQCRTGAISNQAEGVEQDALVRARPDANAFGRD
jgi:hypothetical protein